RPEANVVRFDGEHEGRVLAATAERLEVEVPEIPLPPGGSKALSVTLASDGADAGAVQLTVFQAPRLHGISPSVAMPGEEVVLAGTGWGSTVRVTFGTLEATALEVTDSAIRVQVPAGAPATQGTSLPVTVTSGNDSSNAAPFVIGRLPLLTAVEPAAPAPGDVLTLRGRGFPLQAGWNDLRIGGVRALVASAVESELKAVVPWVEGAGGAVTVELRVPGSEHVGTWTVNLPPPAETVAFRFSAVRFEDVPGHDHVALTTPLGPAFVISGSGGHSAAERALVYLQRLNEAVVPLRATLTSDLEARGLEAHPSIGLVGNPQPLLEVTEEDAAAHEESWVGAKGRGAVTGEVTPERLATWWAALARDLVLFLVRGERPRHTVALAPEGRTLTDLFDVARGAGRVGLPVAVVNGLKPPQREALRLLGLRLPAALRVAGASAAAPAGVPAFTLPGIWTGWESEAGERKYVTLNFTAEGGTLTYERALSLTLPLLSVEQPRRGTLRYVMRSGARIRYYEGTWDGQKVKGRIFSDPERSAEVGAFELERKR
ncbi:MAG TPA: IPT/TIG domain-containing protein, partial [Vicinamibacteria bacterium]